MSNRSIVATWSGGIDSTAVIANLLANDWNVHAYTLRFGDDSFMSREREARQALYPLLSDLGNLSLGVGDGQFLYAFSPDGVEIPTRNRRILDHMIAKFPHDRGFAMGEYIGCDTWVVRDHVGAADCDARALTSYLYEQYGLDYRLITLADFGDSRYKSDRLMLGANVLGFEGMALTSNCLTNFTDHCGSCYKCLERRAAFMTCGAEDPTDYKADPGENPHLDAYLQQMRGEHVVVPHSAIGK